MENNKQLFYSEFKYESIIISKQWKNFINDKWESYFGFEGMSIPSIIWKQEVLLREIDKVFPFKHVGLIRLPANYNYNWHKDINRGCGINMLLEHDESYTLFDLFESKRQTNPSNNEHHNFDQFGVEFIELKYKINKFYAFNTQQMHCVLNFNKPRYLFTVEFKQDHKELPYEILYKWMEINNLIK
tara:strand:+ start:91 stop:648 length:558 start_codon:yes stop_codon:yes gene_type:complete